MLGLDQRELADLCGVSLPTIQRMESSGGTVRGMIDTLVKIVAALDAAGIELLGDNAPSSGVGRGVRLKEAHVQRVPVSAVKGKDATDDTDAA